MLTLLPWVLHFCFVWCVWCYSVYPVLLCCVVCAVFALFCVVLCSLVSLGVPLCVVVLCCRDVVCVFMLCGVSFLLLYPV